jgi:hypothetical protein
MPATIKPITPAEIPALLSLIRELAKFELLENAMEATVDSLRESLFAPNPAAGALLAHENGEVVGYAIYFFTFSSFLGRRGIWLEDVFVLPQFRNQGTGRRLINAVARIGAEANCGRFEWTALDWNKNALAVYEKMGAQVLHEWVLLRLDAKALRKLASPPKDG